MPRKHRPHIDSVGYRVSIIDGKRGREHRIIWEKHNGKIPKGSVVHHKNHDKLDNRIENLSCLPRSLHQTIHSNEIAEGVHRRGLSFLQNTHRKEKKRSHYKGKKTSSRYKGVSLHTPPNKWSARITVYPGKNLYIGIFTDEVAAAQAYDKMALKHFGKHANLNFKGETK